jgi:hypothetical protein
MIIKLTCSIREDLQGSLVKLFTNKVSTCLSSLTAFNTTPHSVAKNYGIALSFWYVDEAALKKFYGGKTAIDALVTYPGVISATVMDLDIDPNTLRDLTQYELECLVWSGGRELGKS